MIKYLGKVSYGFLTSLVATSIVPLLKVSGIGGADNHVTRGMYLLLQKQICNSCSYQHKVCDDPSCSLYTRDTKIGERQWTDNHNRYCSTGGLLTKKYVMCHD